MNTSLKTIEEVRAHLTMLQYSYKQATRLDARSEAESRLVNDLLSMMRHR